MTKIKCMICGEEFEAITYNHLKLHNLTMKEYRLKFPDAVLSSDERNKKISNNNAMKNPKNRKKVSDALKGREVPWIKGKHLTEEHCRKLSENNAMKRPEVRKKLSNILKGREVPWIKGVPKSEEHRKKIGDSNRGKVVSEETKEKLRGERPYMRGDKNPMSKPENREKQLQATRTDEFRNTARERAKKNWQDPEYVLKVLKAENQKPTKPEKEITALLNVILPNEYIYNGKFNEKNITLIGGKLPDFVNINGKKKLIEFNGCYFHNCPICYPQGGIDNNINGIEESQERINHFKQYGFDTLIIWEHELKNKNLVINKILNFHDLPCKLCTKQLTID